MLDLYLYDQVNVDQHDPMPQILAASVALVVIKC